MFGELLTGFIFDVMGEGFNGFNSSNLHKLGHHIVHVHCICERSWQLHNRPAERSLLDSEWICLFCVLAGGQRCEFLT